MSRIPELKTEEEKRDFWATHDSADYFDDMEDEEVEVRFRPDKNIPLFRILVESHRFSTRPRRNDKFISSNVK
jgi:hypothetical protein